MGMTRCIGFPTDMRLSSLRDIAVALTLLAGCGTDPSPTLSIGDNGGMQLPGNDSGVSAANLDASFPQVDHDSGSSLPPANAGGSTITPIDPAKCGAASQMAMNMLQPVDIVIGIDTTGSMAEEIGFTEENMNAFSQQISAAGIDPSRTLRDE